MGVTGSLYGGGIFCALVMIGINFFVIVGTNSAGSRIVWSMARDKAFPNSEYLSQVSPRLGIPLRAIGFVVVIDLILGMSPLVRKARRYECDDIVFGYSQVGNFT